MHTLAGPELRFQPVRRARSRRRFFAACPWWCRCKLVGVSDFVLLDIVLAKTCIQLRFFQRERRATNAAAVLGSHGQRLAVADHNVVSLDRRAPFLPNQPEILRSIEQHGAPWCSRKRRRRRRRKVLSLRHCHCSHPRLAKHLHVTGRAGTNQPEILRRIGLLPRKITLLHRQPVRRARSTRRFFSRLPLLRRRLQARDLLLRKIGLHRNAGLDIRLVCRTRTVISFWMPGVAQTFPVCNSAFVCRE